MGTSEYSHTIILILRVVNLSHWFCQKNIKMGRFTISPICTDNCSRNVPKKQEIALYLFSLSLSRHI